MATGWSFTRTLFPLLTRHPFYSATICCAVFSPPSSHLILVQSSSAHPARTPHALRFAVVYTGCAEPPARPLREQATWWRGGRGSRRLQLRQHDTPVAHLDSSGAAELKLGRELAPRRPCDLHRKTADNSAARGGLVMDQRGRRCFEGHRYGARDATPCSSRRLV